MSTISREKSIIKCSLKCWLEASHLTSRGTCALDVVTTWMVNRGGWSTLRRSMWRKANTEATLSRDPVPPCPSSRSAAALPRSHCRIWAWLSRCQAESFFLCRPAIPHILGAFPTAGDLRASLTPSLHILAMGGRKETGVRGGYVFGCEIPMELQG
jgi:hypothetical protein